MQRCSHADTPRLACAPLGGQTARRMLDHQPDLPDSLLVVEPQPNGEPVLHVRTNGLIRILSILGGPWTWVARALRTIPRPWRDSVYDVIAGRRTRWFSAEPCPLEEIPGGIRLLP